MLECQPKLYCFASRFLQFCIQHEIFPHRWPLVVHPWPPQNVSWPPRLQPVGLLRWEVRWPAVGCPGLSARVAIKERLRRKGGVA